MKPVPLELVESYFVDDDEDVLRLTVKEFSASR